MTNDWYEKWLETIYWLLYGAPDVKGAKILRKEGFRGYYKYRVELCCNYLDKCIEEVKSKGI